MKDGYGSCARDGCPKHARGDEFCSRYCYERHNGLLDYEPNAATKQEHRRIVERRKKKLPQYVEVENTDAMTRVVPGSFESGKRSR